MLKKFGFVLSIILLPFIFYAQEKNWTNNEIYDGIRKLNILGSVLYVAAHPDDENTRLITALSKDKLYRTAYISLTRGDGGQNLIGSELDEYLGVIRSNELIEARKIDGGIQYFSRANDFGYSKNAEETYATWNPTVVQSDLVRVIREFKPDVIINRFDHRTSGKTHGHHTASAIMALEAFQKNNDPQYFPDIPRGNDPINIQRIFFNTSWFFWGSRENFEKADKTNFYNLEVGNYLDAYGLSCTEIAAQSRSMHKSQGFGINSTRGTSLEYFERLDASKPSNEKSPFDGLDFSWNRIKNSTAVSKLIEKAIAEFNHQKSYQSIPILQEIESEIEKLESNHWTKIKLQEVRNLITQCAGIYIAAYTDQQVCAASNPLKISYEIISRSTTPISIISVHIPNTALDSVLNTTLKSNNGLQFTKAIIIADQTKLTSPFWLWNGRGKGNYSVDDDALINQAITPRSLECITTVSIANKNYTISKPVYYKNDDPVLGEVSQPLDVLPSIVTKPYDANVLLAKNEAKDFSIIITANADNQSGTLHFKSDPSISIEPKSINYNLVRKNELKRITIKIKSNVLDNSTHEIQIFQNESKLFTHTPIKYPHINQQNILTPSKIKVIAVNLKTKTKNIAYIKGAGDYSVEALRKMNYSIDIINPNMLRELDPKKYPVLLFGIRALNTNEALSGCKNDLIRYMTAGGRVIMQYNTTAELVTDDFAPSNLKISRDRITDELSPVQFNLANHPILNTPNKITKSDFENWVQERGLYFPNTYDSTYQEILIMNDPKEKDLRAAILYKQVGKGSFIYTPLSWFRQLPAGVPGAYRLFANMISF